MHDGEDHQAPKGKPSRAERRWRGVSKRPRSKPRLWYGRLDRKAMSKVAGRLRACWTKSKPRQLIEQTDRRIQGAAQTLVEDLCRRGR